MTNKKYIKSIEITNFKNFSQKTTFEFAQGLNVIVGENGSGKSNLLDCINFALGKNFRGDSKSELFNSEIYSDTVTVKLTINTGDTITKELKKISNDKIRSRYFINDKSSLKALITRLSREIKFEVMDDCAISLSDEQAQVCAKEIKLKSETVQIIVVSNRGEIINIANKIINIAKKGEK